VGMIVGSGSRRGSWSRKGKKDSEESRTRSVKKGGFERAEMERPRTKGSTALAC
jgi:hypothetical protein